MKRLFLFVLGLLMFGGFAARLSATVYLSATTFAPNTPPYVWTDESLPAPYKLRVKILSVPGVGDLQAVNAWNNNNETLETVPAPGVYSAQLYWVKYTSDMSTVLQVGTMYNVTLTINYPPVPSISVDGYSSGGVITRPVSGGTPLAVPVTAHYNASDANSNLSGIRYNVWNETTGYFDNGGGGFIAQSGASGAVTRSVSLNSDGDWYFWTDAQDANGASTSTGPWSAGFHLIVQEAPSVSAASVSPTGVSPGQQLTFYGTASDPNSNLTFIEFFVNGPGMSGWNFVGSQYYSGGTGSATGSCTWTAPSQTGVYTVQARAIDSYGVWDLTGGVTASFTVLAPQATVSSQNVTLTAGTAFTPSYFGGSGTGAWQFVISNYTNWGGTTAGTLLSPGNTPATSWTPTTAGSYQFWVRKCGDSSYADSNNAGAYTLTVNSPPTYALTVQNGSGAGNYLAGTAVAISAAAPATGFAFSNWALTSGGGTFASASASNTTFTMGAGAATVSATYVDVQAPGLPSGMSSTSLASTSFTLNWNAASDNVGVTAYEVRRDGISLGTTASLSMPIASLTANTTYQMAVRAGDAAGNWSAWSANFPVTTNANAPQADDNSHILLNVHIPY